MAPASAFRLTVANVLLLVVVVLAPAAGSGNETATAADASGGVKTGAYPGPGIPIGGLFIFGDSLWDAGNNALINSTSVNTTQGFVFGNGPGLPPVVNFTYNKPNLSVLHPPYSLDYKPGSGRATNGKLAVDFLASSLGLPDIPPSHTPNVSAVHGLNFASVGATATGLSSKMALTLSEQVGEYVLFKSVVLQSTTFNPYFPNPNVFFSALHVVSIGNNDVIYALTLLANATATTFKASPSTAAEPATLLRLLQDPAAREAVAAAGAAALTNGFKGVPKIVKAVFREAVGNISLTVQSLINNGAHRVLVTGVLPGGCAPAIRQTFNVQPGRCQPLVNALFKLFNKKLHKAIRRLRLKHPRAVILEAQVYRTFYLDVVQPKNEGLSSVTTTAACCGAPPPNNALGPCGISYTFPNGTKVDSTLCGNRDSYFYFDGIHPTQVGHKVYADLLWSGKWPAIQPFNVKYVSDNKL